jgi:hypothetical protein
MKLNRFPGTLVLISALAIVGATHAAHAQGPASRIFNDTGSNQAYVKPNDVSNISVYIWGDRGGNGYTGGKGSGALAAGQLSVAPGEAITFPVGSAGEGGSEGGSPFFTNPDNMFDLAGAQAVSAAESGGASSPLWMSWIGFRDPSGANGGDGEIDISSYTSSGPELPTESLMGFGPAVLILLGLRRVHR